MVSYFSKETSKELKGIMIIFMFIHHMFTIPGWHNEVINYPELSWMATYFYKPFRICVPVFAFLTGYAYNYSSKDFKYSLKKITDIMITYWVVYILYLVIAIETGCMKFDLKSIVLELFALERPIMVFCWYVYFYFMVMLVLPLVEYGAKKNIWKTILFGIILPYFICKYFTANVGNIILKDISSNFGTYFPIVIIGLLVSKYSLFDCWFDRVLKNNINEKWIKELLWIALVLIMFWGQNYKDGVAIADMKYLSKILSVVMKIVMRYMSIPIFVYAMVNLIENSSLRVIKYLISILGNYSLLMWFIHCIFFNVCYKYFQPILYFLYNPILVLIWGLILCCSIAVVINIPIRKILGIKNR